MVTNHGHHITGWAGLMAVRRRVSPDFNEAEMTALTEKAAQLGMPATRLVREVVVAFLESGLERPAPPKWITRGRPPVPDTFPQPAPTLPERAPASSAEPGPPAWRPPTDPAHLPEWQQARALAVDALLARYPQQLEHAPASWPDHPLLAEQLTVLTVWRHQIDTNPHADPSQETAFAQALLHVQRLIADHRQTTRRRAPQTQPAPQLPLRSERS